MHLINIYKVEGTSMLPTFAPGDRVIIQEGLEVAQGQIVAFQYNSKKFIHRVIYVSKRGKYFLEKGDNDPIISLNTLNNVIGIKIPQELINVENCRIGEITDLLFSLISKYSKNQSFFDFLFTNILPTMLLTHSHKSILIKPLIRKYLFVCNDKK